MFTNLIAAVANNLPDGGRKCILVVDDEVDIRESLQTLLEGEFPDVSICMASSGEEAISMLNKKPVDLVISDYKMPGMNGLDLLSRIKVMAPSTKRALITAFPDSVMLFGDDTPNLEFFLSKPIKIDTMVANTQKALAMKPSS